MHGIECIQSIAEVFNINLNGLGGDGIHGGSFLTSVRQHFSTTNDPYGYRGRRYIRVGTMLDELWIHNRFPFYDNELLTFTMSLPAAMRRNSYFYRNALLLIFPDYFKSIPWQKTGLPISAPEPVIRMSILLSRIYNQLVSKSRCFGFLRDRRHDYADYASWIRVDHQGVSLQTFYFPLRRSILIILKRNR
jgi:asparagine synthase (glutamine-hydrolysing)